MKDENKIIIWLNYFDSSLPRHDGRRVPLSMASRGVDLEMLKKAVENIGFVPEVIIASYPKSPFLRSGYVSIKKSGNKSTIIKSIAKELQHLKANKST